MLQIKRLAAAAMTVCALAATAPASAVIVGGIDFGATGALSHLETATVAATWAPAVGDVSTSYGLITTVNGDTTYCADGTSNCALYFISTATVTDVSGGLFHLGSTKITVYYSAAAALNLLGDNSLNNLAAIGAMTPWVTLKGENGIDGTAAGFASDTQGTLLGSGTSSVSFVGTGLVSVDLAGPAVAGVGAFLDANTQSTTLGTFADIAFNESTNNFALNLNDTPALVGLADHCGQAGPADFQTGDWCLQGTINLRGATVVPTPGSLALLGLGLFGIGATRRALAAKAR